MFDRLDDILIRFEELLHELGDPVLASDPEKFRRLMKEQAELAPLVETYTQYKKTKKSIEENLELLEEERDEEMRELLKEIANAVTHNYPDMHLIILLIDERPEEVTDIRESIQGDHVEVIYSTFDETPEHHKQVAEMVLERAKRLVEHKQDVMVLLDSLTRLARAYNLTVTPSGRTLSGGLDPAALHMPKKFFGAARNMREGGSLTILATALVDTGSRLDDMVFEEFKGTGNMELVLDRKLSERRIFPAIDITRSGTRREDLLLTPDELTAVSTIRKSISGLKNDDAIEQILNHFVHTKNNAEFIETLPKVRP